MGKHTEKRNMHTFTIRMSFANFWKLWVKLLPRQKELTQFKYRRNSGLISITICKLIYDDLYKHKDLLTDKELEELEKAEEFSKKINTKESEDEKSN
jgi:lysine/ornithine N-monooxygenase